MKLIFIAVLFLAFGIAGCYYDNEEELYNCSVDPAKITFSTTVASLLTGYGCTGCHSGGSPGGGYNFTTYAGVKASVDAGRLYGSISHTTGFTPMPQGGAKMSACDIRKIKSWIDAGALNN